MGKSSPGLWVTDPAAYRKKLDDLVADRDPIEIMSETADVLASIANAHSADQLRTRPFEGKWTPNEIIGHLLDGEWVYGYRLRLILCEDKPTILGMDQERWVADQNHNDREPAELVAGFRSMRELNLHIWRGLEPKDLERAGLHDERGVESLGMMLSMLAGHDLWHIDQIRRYLDAVKSAPCSA